MDLTTAATLDPTVTCDRSDHDHTSLQEARTCAAVATCRTVPGGMSALYRSARTLDAFLDKVGCPVCACTKSDDPDEPNRRTEACDDDDCICH